MKRKLPVPKLLLPVAALVVGAAIVISVLLVSVVGGIRDRALAGVGERYDDPVWIAGPNASYTYGSKQSTVALDGEEKHSYAYGAFSGAKTLWTAESRCTVEITHEEDWADGRFKLVLVTPKHEVVEISGQPSPLVLDAEPGAALKAVGDAAQDVRFTLTIKNSAGDWEE